MAVARSKLRQHWDKIFLQEEAPEPDEWFVPYAALAEWFGGRGRLRVLVAGCGRSALGVELWRLGHHVVNLDISEVAIEQMRERHPECVWVVGDVTNMTGLVRDGCFDVVVDKGTSDTLCFRVSTKQKHMRTVMLRSFLTESYRVLASGGRLLVVTTRARIKGLHVDGHANEHVEETTGCHEDVGEDWWRAEAAERTEAVVVRRDTEEEEEGKRGRNWSDILPQVNYPFRRIVCRQLSGVVPHIDEKFNSRPRVHVHEAVK